MTNDLEDLAALDALGILTADDRVQYQDLLAIAEPATRSRALLFREATSLIADSLPTVQPPSFVKASILEKIDSIGARNGSQPERSRTIRASEGQWSAQPIPGIEVKTLSIDDVRGIVTMLMRLAPGAIYPAHVHTGAEESFVVSGDCRIGNVALTEGDFHRAERGTEHGRVTTEHGCVVLLVVEKHDYLVA